MKFTACSRITVDFQCIVFVMGSLEEVSLKAACHAPRNWLAQCDRTELARVLRVVVVYTAFQEDVCQHRLARGLFEQRTPGNSIDGTAESTRLPVLLGSGHRSQ